jgi:hypothetical protein
MDEPSIIANRLTETAKNTVDEARAIAKDAIADAADVEKYSAAKVIDSSMKVAELALSSGLQATRDVLGLDPPPSGKPKSQAAEGRRLVADAMEAIARRMIRQSSHVAQETADLVDKNPGSPSVWVQSLVKLGDIAMLGGIELAETALIGPAPFEKKPAASDIVTATDKDGRRKIRVKQPKGLTRPGTADPIPTTSLRFYVAAGDEPDTDTDVEAPHGILKDGQTRFYVAALPVGMISGVYVGHVELVRLEQKLVGGQTQEVETTVLQTSEVEVPL